MSNLDRRQSTRRQGSLKNANGSPRSDPKPRRQSHDGRVHLDHLVLVENILIALFIRTAPIIGMLFIAFEPNFRFPLSIQLKSGMEWLHGQEYAEQFQHFSHEVWRLLCVVGLSMLYVPLHYTINRVCLKMNPDAYQEAVSGMVKYWSF